MLLVMGFTFDKKVVDRFTLYYLIAIHCIQGCVQFCGQSVVYDGGSQRLKSTTMGRQKEVLLLT